MVKRGVQHPFSRFSRLLGKCRDLGPTFCSTLLSLEWQHVPYIIKTGSTASLPGQTEENCGQTYTDKSRQTY